MITFKKLNVNLTQMECDRSVLSAIRARFTSVDPSARFIRFGSGVICPITTMGNFATPILLEVAAAAKEMFPGEEISVDPVLVPIIRPDLCGCTIEEPQNREIALRDYQREAAEAMIRFGRGILKVPTRGGKSLVLYAVAASIFKNKPDIKTALLLVPNTQLINQMYNDFTNYGTEGMFDVVRFSAKNQERPPEEHPRKRLIISNRQWLQEHLNLLPKKIDLVFMDECHTCCAGGFAAKFIKMFKTNYKFGMTATDSDKMKNVWNVKKIFGPVVYEVPFAKLEDEGFVARPEVVSIEVYFKKGMQFDENREMAEVEFESDESGNLVIADEEREEQNGYIIESQFLASSEEFNDIIVKLIDASSKKGNCLVLFDRTMHGKMLFGKINNQSKLYVDGKVSTGKREKIVEILQSNNHAVLVAQSATMGVGLTIKSLSAVFLVNLKSATTSTLQGIGRGLMVEEGKDSLTIFDISASGPGDAFKYSKRHREKREKLFGGYYGEADSKIHRIDI